MLIGNALLWWLIWRALFMPAAWPVWVGKAVKMSVGHPPGARR